MMQPRTVTRNGENPVKSKRIASVLLAATLMIGLLTGCSENNSTYKKATGLLHGWSSEGHEEALSLFVSLGEYMDAPELAEEARSKLYDYAKKEMSSRSNIAAGTFEKLGDYKDSAELLLLIEYRTAVTQYHNGNFDKAMESFEGVPSGYQDRDIYVETINALVDYQAEAWLDAARKFDLLYQQLTAILTNDRNDFEERFVSYTSNIITPLLGKLGFHGNNNTNWLYHLSSLQYVSAPVWSTSSKDKVESIHLLYKDLTFDCLYHYWNEQYMLGNDITALSNFPFNPDHKDFIIEKEYIDEWRDRRRKEVEKLIQEQHLWAYIRADSSISPVAVTGIGLYISNIVEPKWILNIYRWMPESQLFLFADRPENARYSLMTITSHSLYGTYDNGTKGYSTTVEVLIKDVSTGGMLFRNSYTADPPHTAPRTNTDTYAEYDFSRALEDTFSVLEQLYPVIGN